MLFEIRGEERRMNALKYLDGMFNLIENRMHRTAHINATASMKDVHCCDTRRTLAVREPLIFLKIIHSRFFCVKNYVYISTIIKSNNYES